MTINAGTLALDYSKGAGNNILQSGSALTINQGALSVIGNATTDSQTLSTVAFGAGQDNITMVANGTSNTLTFSGATTSTTAGSTMLITSPANTSVVFTTSPANTAATTGRNLVFSDGTNVNWAANNGAGTAIVSNASGPAAVQYAGLTLTGGTDTSNSQILAAGGATTTMTGARTTNSLMIGTAGGAGALNLGTTTMTLSQGGLLFTGSNPFTIYSSNTTTGLKSYIAAASDNVINNYGSGVLTITAPFITGNGTSTVTFGGTGTTLVGNSTLTDIGTYGGVTSINGGLVQLATGVASAGSTTNTAVTINGGTLDVNNNNFGMGALIGGTAAVITNSSGAGVTLTVGNNNSNGTYNGTITNAAGSPLTISKVGTGIVFLGDAVTGGSNAFTGNLLVAGGGSVTLNGIADTPSTYIKLGSAALTGVLTFAGNNNMVLNNRAIDILGSGGGGASITSSSIAGANNNGVPAVIVINTPLGTSGVASGPAR